MLSPRYNPSLPPRFYEMDEYAFEEMCQDLFAAESGIATCNTYGTRGQMQRGIDLLARSDDGKYIEVGQCKCYEDFPPLKIRQVSEAFFKHLDYWKKHKVRRFILFVASELETTDRQDEISNQIKLFQRHKIKYEVWEARTLRQKLSPHHAIALRYLRSQDLVESICGLQPQHTSRISELTIGIFSSKIDRLSSDISKVKALRLDEYRELYHQGKLREARICLDSLRNDEHWDVFDKPLQARILQAISGYTINVEQNADKARSLAEEAYALDPKGDDTLLQVLIAYQSEGAEAALRLIDNTSTINLFNLKLGLLLDLEHTSQVIAALQNLPQGLEPDIETNRIHALALLGNGDIAGAQVKIQQALYEKPNWEKVRATEATINYFSALSSAIPRQLTTYPHPVEWSLIKRDDESLKYLRKAAEEFQRLAYQSELGEHQRKYWQVWHLACLTNDPEQQSEAQELCSTLLSEDPTNPQAITWKMVLNYDIDLSPSQQALETLLQNENIDLERIIALLEIYLYQDTPKKALELLTREKDAFVRTGNEKPWLFWHVQALAASGDIENALQEIEPIDSPEIQRSLRVSILRKKARIDGDGQILVQCLESCWQESKSAIYLLELCQLQASLQNWTYVADKAEDLVNSVGTLTALSLAAECAWQSNRAELCLSLLNDHKQLFPSGTLPTSFGRIKVYCLAQLGLISQGVTEAEELVRSHETAETLTTLIELQLNQGNLRGAAINAFRLLKQENVYPLSLLRIARCLLSEDRNLARELWQRAIGLEITPEILGEVISLGYYLELDRELPPFIHRAQIIALAGGSESPFHSVELNELLEMQQNWANNTQEIYKKYDESDFPIHLIAQTLRFPLTKVFHVLPKTNASNSNPYFQVAILARYGARPFPEFFVDSTTKWRLHLDISAFLLAAHLGILDAVERRFSPIHISQSLPKALLQECEYFQPHQPSRLYAYREILRLHQASQLQQHSESLLPSSNELVEQLGEHSAILLEQARTADGLVVEFLPLQRLDSNSAMQSSVLDEADRQRMINCRTLIELLNKKGTLSSSAYETALQDLGDQRYANLPPQLPDHNAPIFINSELAILLAGSGLLVKICRAFRVFVSPQFIQEAQATITSSDHSAEVLKWLRDLTQRVSTGLLQGKYKMLATPQTVSEQEHEPLNSWDANGLTVYDLFRYTPQSNDVIWIDDRFFSKYPNRDNSVPVIGVLEILEALRGNDDLSESQYYEKILQLRKSNIRYISIASKEILYHLKQAQVSDKRVRETEELEIIRRYIASCLLDSQRLQRPPLPEKSPNPDGEMMFVFECLRAVQISIINIWEDTSVTVETAFAYSDWILQNLYTGMFGVQHLFPNSDPNSDALDLISLDISELYFRGIQLWRIESESAHATSSRRQKYFEWIEQRISEMRFRANPELISSVAQQIKEIMFHLGREQDREQEESLQLANRLMLKDLFRDLPSVLQDELKTDPDLMSYLQIQLAASINIEFLELPAPLIFPASEFFSTVASAINGEESTIKTFQPEVSFRVCTINQTDISVEFQFMNESNSNVYAWQDNLMLLASENPIVREQVLRSHRIWFDCDNSTFEKVVNEIVSTLDLRKRINQANHWHSESAAIFYLSLENKVYERSEFSTDDLIPPSAVGLLRHFYLDRYASENINFHAYLNQAAKSMLESEDLETCIERFSCMPVKLPLPLEEAFQQLSNSVREPLLHRLTARLTSPVCKLHLINLALLVPNSTKLAQNLLDELYSDVGNLQFKFFRAVLDLLNREFSYWHEMRAWSAPTRLVMIWAHTSKLYNLLYNPEVILEEFIQRLEEHSHQRQISADILDRDPEFWNNVLHLRHLNRMNLIVHGLATILKDRDPAILQAAKISEKVIDFAVKNLDEQQFLNPELFHDITLAQDSIESFLGGNRSDCLGYLLGEELGHQVSSDHLKLLLTSALDALISEPLSSEKWLLITWLIGDFPIYNDLVGKLDNLIREINFIELYSLEPSTALFALTVACDHTANTINEELRVKLENELVEIAKLINNQEPKEPVSDEISDRFIECTFKLTVRANDPRTTSLALNDLFKRIFYVCPRFLGRRMIGLSRGLQELPANQLHGAWVTNLIVRALCERP